MKFVKEAILERDEVFLTVFGHRRLAASVIDRLWRLVLIDSLPPYLLSNPRCVWFSVLGRDSSRKMADAPYYTNDALSSTGVESVD